MKKVLIKTALKQWPWLGLLLGTLMGVGVASAQLNYTINEYTPSTTDATTAEVSLACGEVGYHAYTFEIATEDLPSSNFDDYYADITRLRFNLQEDFINNVDLTDMDCTIPLTNSGSPIYINCDGGTFTRVNTSTNLRINSTLAMHPNGTATITMRYLDPNTSDSRGPTLPWITTDPNYENFIQQSISFHDNGNVAGGETATTDAEIFQIVYGFNYNTNGSWNASSITQLPDNASIGFDNNNWYSDGDMAIANFEGCEQLACDNLQITSPTALTFANLGNNVVTRLEFETEDQNGDPWEGDYLVQGFQSDGVTPSTCEFSNTCWWGNICTNWQPDQLFFDADDIDPRVRNCQLGDIVTIEEVDFPAACNDSLSFEDGCEELNIISTQIINNFFGEFTRVEVNATTLAGQPWPLPYIYSVTNAAGAPVARQFGANVLQAVAATPVTTFQTNAAIVFIRNLQPGDQVDVEAAGGYANVCNDSFQVADECLSMGVMPTTIAVDDIDSPTQITLTPQGANGPWNGTYTYSATNSAGGPSTCEFASNYAWSLFHLGSNPLTTALETVWVNDCGQGDIITMQENNYPEACNGTITVEEEIPPVLACASLSATPTILTLTDLTQPTEINLAVNDNFGNPWNGTYNYTATDSSGGPSTCLFYETLADAQNNVNGQNPLTSSQETVWVNGCTGGDTISISETSAPTVCADTIATETPPPPPVCIGLTISPTSVVSSSLPQVFTLTPNPSTWPGPWVWSTTNPLGVFTEVANPSNRGPTIVTSTLEVSYEGAAGDVITVKEGTIFAEVCNARAEITPPPEVLACIGLNISPTSVVSSSLPQVFTLTPNPSTWPGPWVWSTTNPLGVFTEVANPSNRGPTIVTSTLEVSYEGAAGDIITVKEGTIFAEVCDATANITPPPVVLACIGLSISPTSVVSSSLPQVFTLTPNPSTWPGPWVWSTTNPLGVFTEVANPANTGNTITTSTLQVSYQGAAGDGITVVEGTIFAEVCDATANITPPPEVLACIGLTISPTSVVSSSLPQVFTLTPNPSTWPGPWVWSTTNPFGGFTEVANPSNRGPTIVTTTLEVSYEGAAGDVITVKEGTIFAEVCDATANITPPPPKPEEPYCGDKISGNTVGEECDDGNAVDNDDCSNSCKLPPGLPGNGGPGGGGGNNTFCGDGKIQSPNQSNPPKYEICDEGPNGGIIRESRQGAGQYCSNSCDITVTPPSVPLPQPQPNDMLTKSVETYNFGWMNVGTGADINTVNANCFTQEGTNRDCDPIYAHDFDYAFYQLTYTPDATLAPSVIITDSITDELPSLTPDGNQYDGYVEPYTAVLGDPDQVKNWANVRQNGDETFDDMRIFYEGGDIEILACEFDSHNNLSTEGLCSENSIADSNGVTLHNLNKSALPDADIVIRYLGQVHNGNKFDCTKLLNPDSSDYSVCPVQFFRNFAETSTHKSDSSDIAIVCPFFLTRNAGDVYIDPNAELQTYDLSCYYDYKNSDALVISENSTNAASLLSRFSSYIGNLFTQLENRWKQLTVRSQVKDRNIGAVTRYKENEDLGDYLPTSPSSTVGANDFVEIYDMESQLAFLNMLRNNPKQNVYQIVGKDLVFNLGNNKVPPGAYTFIVRGGNLRIKSNLTYDDTTPINELSSLKKIPSIAFIVIGGNVEVDSRVSKMVGVYYVQSETTTGPTGTVTQGGQLTGDWTDPFTELEIHGSVYGNINSLLGQRTFAGPANYDHGNVVLRYDERILLNPPPGLEEYIDLSSERVAR